MIEFFVAGIPVAQGSKRAFVNKHTGRASVVDNNKSKLVEWRGNIHSAAEDCIAELLSGAVVIEATFVFVRPKSISAKKRPNPTVAPDIDKLLRALLDALTGVAFADDDQVTECIVSKRYGAPGEQPGVHVVIDRQYDGVASYIAATPNQEALAW